MDRDELSEVGLGPESEGAEYITVVIKYKVLSRLYVCVCGQ